ncbi:hypothetical protein BD310DRAFT_917257 [Dichomitus squalens]|uniref:Uncharacterized protein n=1 Tax=Dichomitus squalens TaxID=114155 RepID=A0A4Q9Q7E1_9APHY|nr:hypothetical protein BD310DRAFT_917257 [Dichomitus squalens]
MGFEGLWATRTLAPSKRPDKSQLASAEQAMDGCREDTRKHVSSTLWVIDERNLNVTTITVWGPMGYGVEFPLSRLGKAKILWVFRVYGLPGVWVRRVSTVHVRAC